MTFYSLRTPSSTTFERRRRTHVVDYVGTPSTAVDGVPTRAKASVRTLHYFLVSIPGLKVLVLSEWAFYLYRSYLRRDNGPVLPPRTEERHSLKLKFFSKVSITRLAVTCIIFILIVFPKVCATGLSALFISDKTRARHGARTAVLVGSSLHAVAPGIRPFRPLWNELAPMTADEINVYNCYCGSCRRRLWCIRTFQ